MPVDHPARAYEHSALDAVLQLPDVARPMVGHQQVDRGCRDAANAPTQHRRVLLGKVIDQQENVRLPVAQGGHEDAEHVESVI